MSLPTAVVQVQKRRVRKFLKRANDALKDSPVIKLRETYGDGRQLGFNLTWEFDKTGIATGLTIEQPRLKRRLLHSIIVDCRVFFTEKEDCYLPAVVSALRALVGPERSKDRKPLADVVNAVVKDGSLHFPMMYSGRVEQDNGLGPGKLLGDNQLAMDYIYGVALHEDEERLARLDNAFDSYTVELAVLLQLNQLLLVVENLKEQIESDLAKGYLSLD